MKLKKRGFTLIELISVVSIMAVLTAVIVPTYISHVGKSRQTVCDTNRKTLAQEILVNWIVDGGDTKLSEYAYEAKLTDVCPGKGICSVVCNNEKQTLSIICSIHGEFTRTAEDVALDGIGALLQSERLNAYLEMRKGAVNSEAPSNQTDKTLNGVAYDVNQALAKLGFDTNDVSWRVYNQNGQLNYFWSSRNISGMKLGEEVQVYKYDALTGKYSVGTATVGRQNGEASVYNILSVGNVKWTEVTDKRK